MLISPLDITFFPSSVSIIAFPFSSISLKKASFLKELPTSIFIYNTKTKHEVEDQNMTSQTPPSPCKCVEHDTLKNATDECQKTLETGGICDVYSYDVSKYDSGDKKRELYEVVPNLPEVVAEEYLLSNKNEIPFPKYNNFKNEVSFPEERVLEEVTSFYMPWYSCDNCTE